MGIRVVREFVQLMIAFLVGLVTLLAEQPLSQDDVMLLLMSGTAREKKARLIEQRGIDFHLNPDLEKKFQSLGADDRVVGALRNTGTGRRPEVLPTYTATQPTKGARVAPLSSLPGRTGGAGGTPANSRDSLIAEPAPPSNASLPCPDAALVAKIIKEFARKDQQFIEARKNYAYHQSYRVKELDEKGNVVGTHQQEWDVVFGDRGERVARVTYAPADSLKRVFVPADDVFHMRNLQPLMFPPEDLPEYEINYLDHVRVDEITAYVFSVQPKKLKDGRVYFQGTIWVEDQDLEIVKAEGKNIPDMKKRKLFFPHFTTYREQVDGKYWFPTVTIADYILHSSQGPLHAKSIIEYSGYKRFRTEVRILARVGAVDPAAQSSGPPARPGGK